MHIPDGYLHPVFSLGTGVVTLPVWLVAARRVQRVLDNRTVPLLAIFSAFTFTIQMFNVPVPLGTTAHAVGGTLMAIVVGPWAAVVGLSVALVIQALFFGDGGVLAIPANCLNMAVILPFVGYGTYRIVAGGSPPFSGRRVVAGGIGGYLGMVAAALAVAVELGLQPALFSSDGRALYSPYGLQQTIPAMLATHLFGAGLVEGLVTALAIAYLQRRHPRLLRVRRAERTTPEVPAGSPALPSGAVVAGASLAVLLLLAVLGLVTGGGDPARAFGADWSQVDGGAVAFMLLMVAVLAAVLVPAAYLLLPRAVRGLAVVIVAMAILAPVGLIAPGFAYAEGAPEAVQQEFGYVPEGLREMNQAFTAPLPDYNLPVPFFSDEKAPLWRAALGYEISGLVGVLLLGAAVLALAYLLNRVGGPRAERSRPAST